MIIDWNDKTANSGEVFHFKNSLRPFIEAENDYGDLVFIDIQSMTVYSYDDIIEGENLEFYSSEDVGSNDPDFRGIEIDGKIEWVE